MTNTIAKRQNGNPSDQFENVVDIIFQNSLRDFFSDHFRDPGRRLGAADLPVNIRQTDQHFEIDVIAPGCRKEDFNIRLEDKVLTVSFENQEKNEQQQNEWVRNEFVQRSFSRSFTLDDSVDAGNIQAAYTDGILRLQLPKIQQPGKVSRTIDIQ